MHEYTPTWQDVAAAFVMIVFYAGVGLAVSGLF